MKNQKDQYGHNIPQDLMLLDKTTFAPVTFSDEQLKAIDSLDWYCFEGNQTKDIFVSQSKIEEIFDCLFDGVPPEDCVFKPEKMKIVLIDRVLHRWSEQSFYWA